jgi:hypothetical protein
LLQKLADKKITKDALGKSVAADFDLLPEVFNGVSSPKATVRYGCASVLVDLSAEYPEKLYPFMDNFITLLNSKHRILIWNAVAAISNLCIVDKEKKFDEVFDKYFGFINDEHLVTVANVVSNSGRIALAKPYLIPRITSQLLRVEELKIGPHLTEECRRVVAEKAVESFDKFCQYLTFEDKKRVLSFVQRQTGSTRKSLKTKAGLFLRRWSGSTV